MHHCSHLYWTHIMCHPRSYFTQWSVLLVGSKVLNSCLPLHNTLNFMANLWAIELKMISTEYSFFISQYWVKRIDNVYGPVIEFVGQKAWSTPLIKSNFMLKEGFWFSEIVFELCEVIDELLLTIYISCIVVYMEISFTVVVFLIISPKFLVQSPWCAWK